MLRGHDDNGVAARDHYAPAERDNDNNISV
jgi:hypothetical protein